MGVGFSISSSFSFVLYGIPRLPVAGMVFPNIKKQAEINPPLPKTA